MNKTVKEKIEKRLKELNREQVVSFAWRCAIRGLPFLGANGNFDFWKEEDIQKHLFAIFNVLDYTASADSAYASASASASASAAASAYAAAAAAANKHGLNLELEIIGDLNRYAKTNIHTDWYGAIWNNFIDALEKENCGYWARLYENIFTNNFELDREALKKRLNVPKEIREQGAAKVGKYLEQLEKGATHLNEARIIILGDKGSGKTSIARKLIDVKANMPNYNESTAGVDTTLWELEEENINVRIWDFAGHTITHAVHQFFLSERCLYVIVCNGRTEGINTLSYWLDHMKNYGGNSKAIILVNKHDVHSVEVPINTLQEKYDIQNSYSFSIREDAKALKKFRKDVIGFIKNNPSWEQQEIPSNYYQVKEDLEKLFQKSNKENGEEHITKKQFTQIAEKYKVGNVESLLLDLHALGISLWYKDLEKFNTLILNPEWISHGVYQIINWVHEEKKYSLTLHNLEAVFYENAVRFPKEKHAFLFDLMMHYELAFKTDEDLIIPSLLPRDIPKNLPVFPIGESLLLRYKADQTLPPNTISRFIVLHNQDIKTEKNNRLVWRFGVILKSEQGAIALVREEDRTITVSVKGTNKTAYIDSLRKTLNEIFESYKSDKPELQYRVERVGDFPVALEEKNPVWLTDRKILSHVNSNMPYFEDFAKQQISLNQTIINYNITSDNVMVGDGQMVGRDFNQQNFNFQNCNIGLQGSLNELSQLLTENNNQEEAKELENVAKALESVEKCKSPDEVKKKGIANRLKRFVENLGDDDSTISQTIKGVKNGVSIAQDIAEEYNKLAQWLALPQVPKPFLKK